MPVFAADVLPDTSGRNLGNPSQRWNLFAQNVDIQSLSGMPIVLSGMLYAATVPVAAAADTTGEQDLCSCIVPAGLLNVQGKVLRGTFGGTYTTQQGQRPEFGFDVHFGNPPLGLFGFGTPSLLDGMTNAVWRGQFEFTVYTPGSSGQIDSNGSAVYQTQGSNSVGTSMIDWTNNNAIGPIDLTVDQPLQCVVVFSTNTSPANICVQRKFIVEIL